MKKAYKIILFIILPVILTLILVVLIALPYGMRKYINEHGKDYTGRVTSVRDIKINYFTATLNVLDFKLMEADGKSNFVSFDSLIVKLSPFKLLSSKLVVEKFRLVRPEVSIVRKDSVYNFYDIIAFVNSKPKTAPSEKPSEPFQYFLNSISMDQGKLIFDDKTVNHTTTLSDLTFLIPSLSFNQDEIKDAGITFHFENGGSLQSKSEYNQKSGDYKVDFTVDKLDISPFLPYTTSYFKLSGFGGSLGGDFKLSGNVNMLDSIKLIGTGYVVDFFANDLKKQKVLGAQKASVTLGETYPMKYCFRFDDIKLTEPYLYVEMKDSTINWLNLMVESPADTVPFSYYYKINKLKIDNGLMDLRDISYEEPFDYNLSEIEMKVDSFSSKSIWVNTFSTMKLNKRGKLQAELGINPADPYEMKVDYVITNFQLSDLNPYSKHFVGYPILLGNMYYKGKTSIRNKQLTSENKLIVRNARLGKKTKGLMNLPLKLALYLLKDIHGDIILDLPLTGDLNNPSTNIRKLVWQTLKNVVVKVVASPFIALGHLMGVEPAEAKGIEFDYADTTLTSTHLRRIKLFTEIAKKKPDMKIELNYYNDYGLERNELAQIEAGRLFTAATGSDSKKDLDKFKAFLAEKLHVDTLNVITGSEKLVGEHRLDSLLQNCTQNRIRKVEAALKSFDDSTRIKVVIPDIKVPENVGSRPIFELKYSVDD